MYLNDAVNVGAEINDAHPILNSFPRVSQNTFARNQVEIRFSVQSHRIFVRVSGRGGGGGGGGGAGGGGGGGVGGGYYSR